MSGSGSEQAGDAARAMAEELEQLRRRVDQLESELSRQKPLWQARGYYAAYYATTGSLLGLFGASASLLFNIVGSLLVGQHPLRLIQVYLTFPMGDQALGIESGLALAIGCCLYLATGMILGIPFYMLLTWLAFRYGEFDIKKRFLAATVFGILLWIVNFYAILSWLQPLLFGGNWIVRLVPWWVGALTHLVFGWTIALAYPLGLYKPYRPPSLHQG
ncbi:MAG: hypothetical protein KatS3mg110_0563 [Pirellulaceae bacterium]|nr:MAG: hypothetical protein KatS3mg110_0563 [Pirellulaceae bacterium]